MGGDPPLFLDIDGTVTRRDGGLDGGVIDPLRAWEAPVVFATGKAFPYPIALCHYLALPERVVAENGGIVCVDGHIERTIDVDRLASFKAAAADAGIDFGWGAGDTVNRWRETELAVARSTVGREALTEVAAEHGLEVVDSGYAYHVKDPAVTKGTALEVACDILDIDPLDAVAIGDSENDVDMFELAGRSVAVANADEAARSAADMVASVGFADGLLATLDEVRDG